jgi:type IV secretion system T-DNA border endonuclease VirD2
MTGSSVEDLVLGHVLDAKRRGRGGGAAGGGRLGSPKERRTRGLLRNAGAPRSWQSVIKRIAGGSARTPADLKRLLDYVAREEGVESTWCNLAGYEREFDPTTTAKVAKGWSSTWRGAPKRGHTDHIVLSFPRGVDVEQAEAIAREWGQEVFGSGDYGDVWRYVASLHRDTDHVHAHFVVDKHGIDQGRFLSICRYSELNFDVMRELHAEIAQEHGLNLVATTRLSRGLIENPVPDLTLRASRDAGGSVPPAPPPLSEAERARRLAALQDYAQDYEELGQLASIAAGSEAEPKAAAGFLTRLAGALGASATALRQGLPLMPDLSLHEEGDAAARLEAARAEMVAAATEAWEAIRAMEPSAERFDLEVSFAEQARTSLSLAPDILLLAEHARAASHEEDPYFNPTLASLVRLEVETLPGLSLDEGLRATLSHVREELGDRIAALLSFREDDLQAAGTSVEEMVARFMTPEHSEGQLAAWHDQDGVEAKVLWRELERSLAHDVARDIETLELPPVLEEALAKQQILSADRHLRLSEVPALEAIVDRVHEILPQSDLDLVLSGNLTPLAEHVRDPALRAAVAHELKNESDLTHDDTVGPWADLARNQARAAELGLRERSAEHDLGHEL